MRKLGNAKASGARPDTSVNMLHHKFNIKSGLLSCIGLLGGMQKHCHVTRHRQAFPLPNAALLTPFVTRRPVQGSRLAGLKMIALVARSIVSYLLLLVSASSPMPDFVG